MFKKIMCALLGAAVVFVAAGLAQAQEWRLLNPSGVVRIEPTNPAPRLDTLEGKTVVLRWNGKDNGDVVLNRLAERLQQAVPSVKIIKSYLEENAKFSVAVSGSMPASLKTAEAMAAFKPDLVVASTAD